MNVNTTFDEPIDLGVCGDGYDDCRPATDIHGRPAYGNNAATSDLPALQAVLTLSANTRHTNNSSERPVILKPEFGVFIVLDLLWQVIPALTRCSRYS